MRLKRVIVAAAVFTVIAVSGEDRRLEYSCGAVSASGAEWDFTDPEKVSGGVVYRMYGDTLLAEVEGGRRLTYMIRNDTVFYSGEQTRTMRTSPGIPVPTGAFSQATHAGLTAASDTGMRYKRLYVSKEGEYETSLPVRGTIIAGDGLRIPAAAVTETRNYSTYQSADTLQGKGTLHTVEIRTRWFVSGDPLPVAYQYTEKITDSGKPVSEKTLTYLCDFGDIRLPSPETELLRQAVERLDVRYENGRLHVSGESGTSGEITLAVTTLQGTAVTAITATLSEGSNHMEKELPALPYGRYILCVSAGDIPVRKIYFAAT